MATIEHAPLRTLASLVELIQTHGVDIEESFKELHHFVKPAFNTEPRGFSSFQSYCRGLSRGITRGGENESTIQRACQYVEIRRGTTHEQALSMAWAAFPLATR